MKCPNCGYCHCCGRSEKPNPWVDKFNYLVKQDDWHYGYPHPARVQLWFSEASKSANVELKRGPQAVDVKDKKHTG